MRDSTCTNFAAASGAALAHLAVTDRLRHRRVPGAQKIGAERDHIVGAAQIERRQRGMAEAQQICLAQHGFVERLVPDRGRRAEGLQKPLDQFAGAGRAAAAQERPASSSDFDDCSVVRCEANSFSASSQVICLELARTARAGALDGMRDAVGMVEHLQARPGRARRAFPD